MALLVLGDLSLSIVVLQAPTTMCMRVRSQALVVIQLVGPHLSRRIQFLPALSKVSTG